MSASSSTSHLDCMFRPRSVALIGASADPSKLSSRPLRFFREYGYEGRLHPVNPRHAAISGLTCFPSVAAIASDVDLAVISLPASSVAEALRECGEKGIPSAVVISAGFVEVGDPGAGYQRELEEVAARYQMAVCGPNCSGFVYFPKKVTATFSVGLERILPPLGPIAFVSQSGALASYILERAGRLGFGFSYWITTGNEAVLDFGDYLKYVLEDPEVHFVMGYLEEARDGKTFESGLARAAVLNKPVVLLKVGRSAAGAKASASHTGAMAGTDAVYQAVFDRYGVLRADSIGEMLDLARMALGARPPRGTRVQLVTLSGGAGVLMADAASAERLTLASLTPQTQRTLRETLPDAAIIGNPVDLTAELMARQDFFQSALETLVSDTGVDSLVVFLGIVPSAEEKLAQAVSTVAKETSKHLQVIWFPEPSEETLSILAEAGVPVFEEPVRGLRALARWHRALEQRWRLFEEGPEQSNPADGRVLIALAGRARDEKRLVLTESESKALMAEWGLPIPQGGLANTAADAEVLARAIGFPVAMKVVSHAIPHKTEAGVVRLNVGTTGQVRATAEELLERARRVVGQECIAGILVEQMVPSEAREVLVGAKMDPRFGPYILVGMGGTLAEVLHDFAVDLAPVSQMRAKAMLARLTSYQALMGFRGARPADVDSLASVIHVVSTRISEAEDIIAELDINPLFVLPEGEGVRVGDALVVLKGWEGRSEEEERWIAR